MKRFLGTAVIAALSLTLGGYVDARTPDAYTGATSVNEPADEAAGPDEE